MANSIKSVLIIHRHLIYGGAEKYTLNLANALVERGINVTLITGGGPLASHVSPKVKQYILPISRKPRIKEFTERKILDIARSSGAQVIHTQCRASLVCSQLARTTLKIPLVTHEHHMYEPNDYPFIVNELREGSDKIITIGPYTARELVLNGLREEEIIPILNGIDAEKNPIISQEERKLARKLLKVNPTDKVIVCLSRLEPGKGMDKLARGFIKVAQRIPDAKLFIIGDDQEGLVKPFLRKLIEDNKLQQRFFVLNGEYNIRKFHAVADIFCYPPLVKGMAVMEAMAAGLPVVGKETDRKPLVVEDKISGLMTKTTLLYRIDPDEIADKLTFLLNNLDIAKAMGIAARDTIVERFDLHTHVSKVTDVYDRMIGDSFTGVNVSDLFKDISSGNDEVVSDFEPS